MVGRLVRQTSVCRHQTHSCFQIVCDDNFIIGVHQDPARCSPLMRFEVNSVRNHTLEEAKALQQLLLPLLLFFFFLSESNFQASGRNNLKIHLKFLQDLAFSFHISTSGVSQNSMSLKSWLLNPTAECQIFRGCLTHVCSLH